MSYNTTVSQCICISSFGKQDGLLHYSLSFSQQGYSESPDLEFEYADTDKWAAELSGKTQTSILFGGAFFCIGLQ